MRVLAEISFAFLCGFSYCDFKSATQYKEQPREQESRAGVGLVLRKSGERSAGECKGDWRMKHVVSTYHTHNNTRLANIYIYW